MADGSLSAEANYQYHAPLELYTSWLTLMQDVQDDPAAGLDEGLLAFSRPHSRLYGECL
jgi:hypothetical protein